MNKYIYRFATEQEFLDAFNGLATPIVIYIDETQSVLYNKALQVK